MEQWWYLLLSSNSSTHSGDKDKYAVYFHIDRQVCGRIARDLRTCEPSGVFRISCTALTACPTSGNCAMATRVGTTGVSFNVAIQACVGFD